MRTPPPATELIFRNSRRASRAVCTGHLAAGKKPYSSATGCRPGKQCKQEKNTKPITRKLVTVFKPSPCLFGGPGRGDVEIGGASDDLVREAILNFDFV